MGQCKILEFLLARCQVHKKNHLISVLDALFLLLLKEEKLGWVGRESSSGKADDKLVGILEHRVEILSLKEFRKEVAGVEAEEEFGRVFSFVGLKSVFKVDYSFNCWFYYERLNSENVAA